MRTKESIRGGEIVILEHVSDSQNPNPWSDAAIPPAKVLMFFIYKQYF